jgi:hypothetical protein
MSSEDSIKDDVLKQLGDQIKAVRYIYVVVTNCFSKCVPSKLIMSKI